MSGTAKPWNSDSYPMKEGKQRRNFEYSYSPPGGAYKSTQGGSSDDDTSSHLSEASTTHETTLCVSDEKTTQIVRRKKKRRGKKKHVEITRRDVQQDSTVETQFDDGEELQKYWLEQYEKRFGVAYEKEPVHKQLELCDTIIQSLKLALAKRFVLALMTNPELEWVQQKTLSFLAKPGNRSRIAPAIQKRKRFHKAEFNGDRSTELQITFRE
jgi:hypothetical protein